MSRRLFAVANTTGSAATLTNDEGDRISIAASGITHTGGSDGDFVFLSDCSDSTFWAAHHMTIAADDGAWAVSCWVDDQQDRMFLWSAFNGWSSENGVPSSRSPADNCTIAIAMVNGKPAVTWQPF